MLKQCGWMDLQDFTDQCTKRVFQVLPRSCSRDKCSIMSCKFWTYSSSFVKLCYVKGTGILILTTLFDSRISLGWEGKMYSLLLYMLYNKHLICFQTVEHGFPHQPSALGYSPCLQLMAIGTRSGAIKMYPFCLLMGCIIALRIYWEFSQ